METTFSKEIQAGLDQARGAALRASSRLRVQVDDNIHPVLRMWKTGFAMEQGAPALRGRVDLFDGSVHLFQCLIITSSDEDGERRYEFKRATLVSERPAVDFEIAADAPMGLIEDAR